MGEVYRATDTKLSRDLALKLVHADLADDPQRMGRFRREAQVLASLNHPSIAAIHGVEEEDGRHALVMELVEGEDLSQRISRGRIPLDEALPIALQIAEALDAAHEKGIIHRDLKPANVRIIREGQVKVLDFGLAKALEGDRPEQDPNLFQSPTLTMAATQVGVILGTAAYMSPEQARGQVVNRRADIWAFGAVLFEMLTAKKVFQGQDLSLTLANVIKEEPPWEELPGDLPEPIGRLLRGCLVKDPRKRLRDIGDAILEMEEARERREAPAAQDESGRSIGTGHLMLAGLAIVAVTAVITLSLVVWSRPEVPREVSKMTIPTPGLVTAGAWPKISPDGRKALYFTGDSLWVHYFDRFDPERVEGVTHAESPFFSPDSQRMAFTYGDSLWQVRLDGSERRLICEFPHGPDVAEGLCRSDGTILFSTYSGGLYEVASRGGTPTVIIEPNDRDGSILSFELPAGGGYVHSNMNTGTVELLRNGEWTPILEEDDVISAAYSDSGHLLFHRVDAGLWAAPFSIATGRITGGSFQVDPLGGSASFSNNGRLLYPRGRDRSELVRVSRNGTVLETLGTARFMLQDPAVSPDGRWIAVFAREQGRFGIWLHDVREGTARRLTYDKEPIFVAPSWGPDGEVFYSTRDGEIWRQNPSGGQGALKVVEGVGPHVSSDGRILVFTGPSRKSIRYLDWRRDERPQVFLEGQSHYGHPRLSPDGKWLAFSSDEVGDWQVFVRRFPTLEGPWQVSTDGGRIPRWSPGGDELFYVSGRDVMSVRRTPSLRSAPFRRQRPLAGHAGS